MTGIQSKTLSMMIGLRLVDESGDVMGERCVLGVVVDG